MSIPDYEPPPPQTVESRIARLRERIARLRERIRQAKAEDPQDPAWGILLGILDLMADEL